MVCESHLFAQLMSRCSTSTGDVYSFGIILQEIISRCEPYGSTDSKRLPMEPYCNQAPSPNNKVNFSDIENIIFQH